MIQLSRPSIFLVLSALLYLPSNAIAVGPATVLTFDDVAVPAGDFISMPSGYGGVSWASNIGLWKDFQPPFSPQSPPNRVLFNCRGETGIAESIATFIGGPKIFDGAYFSGYDNVQFKLYDGAALVGTSGVLHLGDHVTLIGSGPTFLASGYAEPITSVGIIGTRSWFAMDNFTFHEVPEPSTLLLLGVGAISLVGRRRSKSRS